MPESNAGTRRRSVVLLSGGMDSAANLALCRVQDEPVLALTADYGQRAVVREIAAARRLAEHFGCAHDVVRIPWLGGLGVSSLTHVEQMVPELRTSELDHPDVTRASAASVWVPNRNGVLINVAAAYAEALGATQVIVGFNLEEAATFPDNTAEFMDRATAALAMSTANGLRVHCYTVEWRKRRIVEELARLPSPFPWDLVWSCYHGGVEPCGACESCRRLSRARAEMEAPI